VGPAATTYHNRATVLAEKDTSFVVAAIVRQTTTVNTTTAVVTGVSGILSPARLVRA